MREGMDGSDVVFHIAAWYHIGGGEEAAAKADAINVGGTRNVLRLAHELNIPKIIYPSSIGVFGDTAGVMADENFYQGAPFSSEYTRTKWLAHYKVAQPLIDKGAPIIILMPSIVYGPGDNSQIANMMRMFYRGMPVVMGSDTVFSYVHVNDVADGHILAADRGAVGEAYILAGPSVPLGEMMDFWAYLLGRSRPALRVVGKFIQPLVPVASAIESIMPLPEFYSGEMAAIAGTTYIARADKAKRELGWETRPLQSGMLETFEWSAATEAERKISHRANHTREKKLAITAIISAGLLFGAWLFAGRKK
jgi:nucleoside-diphosphate-sugar epimerase